ncbi:MAG: hypothetical protein H0T69_05800 [Thermoleophilaceae bacterium]|nr:hypothetical protein [Thermoleophilaceae bacterium]
MAVSRVALATHSEEPAGGRLSDEVELYQRTYSTLLRSSGETALRVLESSHRAMGSSLHPLAGSDEPDLGVFIYTIRRLPDAIAGADLVIMGQDAEVFARNGVRIDEWEEADAPARRRRWHDSGQGMHAVLLASASDVDDLIPTLVAFQIEWNKLRVRQRAAGWPPQQASSPEDCAQALGGAAEDWSRLREAWGERFDERLSLIAERRMNLRVRMLGGTQVGYARMTRRWWTPVHERLAGEGLTDRPMYLVSSNTHSLVNIATGVAREREASLVEFVETLPESDILREELAAFREGRTEGSWENFLYFVARLYFDSHGEEGRAARRRSEQESGVSHLPSKTALRVPAQIIPLAKLHPERLDSRLGDVDAEALAESEAVVVNIDYPLGLAAYNILREVAVDSAALRGVYVLGKAATLNADVGDVMLSSVVHDEHSGSTYWLDNAFAVDDLAGDLRFGSGLDNQRAVTVKSTFLQNRAYLDFYYREAFTVVEMEAGPYCNALYEIADADRHPVGEAVNFSKLPLDFGIIHYASDTPYTQARTLGARGLSYYGMDSTYASSLAILRRILRLEGALESASSRTLRPD